MTLTPVAIVDRKSEEPAAGESAAIDGAFTGLEEGVEAGVEALAVGLPKAAMPRAKGDNGVVLSSGEAIFK